MEIKIHTTNNKNVWVYVGNVIGAFSVFWVVGMLLSFSSVQNFTFSNPFCGILNWWISGNYILLSISQVLGIIGFILLLIPSARMAGVACWVGIVLLYLVPIEIGRYSSCWSVNNNQDRMTGQESITQGANPPTADDLLEFPEKPLKTP